MTVRLVVPETPSDRHREAVRSRLVAFNAAHGHPVDSRPVAVMLEGEGGEPVGGLWGTTGFGWLYVEFLVVPEELRGERLGERLMGEAERIARERGCHGAWLTTFTFQARGFYEKLGYETFGQFDHPPGDTLRYFLRKRL